MLSRAIAMVSEENQACAGSLVKLYVRLRDELDSGEFSLDPNHKVRAAIVMAIFAAAEALGADYHAIEVRVRQTLGLGEQALAA
jgi:hypothetical protein